MANHLLTWCLPILAMHITANKLKALYDADSIAVLTSVDEQSADIALGVDKAYESKQDGASEDFGTGAGDQGIIFGYATNETPEYLPPAISFAHRLTRRLAEVRKNGTLPYLRPDGKAQVTVEFEDDNTVKRIHNLSVKKPAPQMQAFILSVHIVLSYEIISTKQQII